MAARLVPILITVWCSQTRSSSHAPQCECVPRTQKFRPGPLGRRGKTTREDFCAILEGHENLFGHVVSSPFLPENLIPPSKLFVNILRLHANTDGRLSISVAWAEMYIVVAGLAQRFDFQLQGAGPQDVEYASDQFIIGTKDLSGIKAVITEHGTCGSDAYTSKGIPKILSM